MFEIGWSEMLVIAVVMIVVVGPKDLPKMLRTIGKMTSKVTSMAADFRKQFDEALKEADLDDVKTSIDSVRKLDPRNEIRKAMNPMEKAAADVRSGLDQMMKPKAAVPAQPASTEPQPAAPLKNGSGLDSPIVAAEPPATAPVQTLQPAAEPAVPASIAAAPQASVKPKATRATAPKKTEPKANGTAQAPSVSKAPRSRKPKESETPT